MSDSPASASVLDRPLARLAAVGVALAALAALGVMHRDDLFPPEGATVAADDPAAACIAEQWAKIDQLKAEGTIDATQAGQFKGRAETLCRGQLGQGGAPPPPLRQ